MAKPWTVGCLILIYVHIKLQTNNAFVIASNDPENHY